MKIETKYEIGDKVWVIYKGDGEVCVYEDVISEIGITKEGVLYISSKVVELKEHEIIKFDDNKKLVKEIKEIMKEINSEERRK